ncbi:MAG: hypothetical protein JF614_23295 [Acidobacteria bacterium]|nr:hypothetical protein [Acidobacteriota bacterium]
MNRASILATLALTLIGGAVSQAAQKPQPQAPSGQSAPAVLESASRGTVAFDDDGGRAQIIPRQAVAGRDATFHGGPVISHGTVQAVFLGSGWRAKANREKESGAMAALRGQAQAATASLAKYRIREWEPAGLALEDPAGDPVASATISDLEIQFRLDNLLSGAGRIEASSVYVVFLAPGLGSTLGSTTSEKDFAAYHNHFHSANGVVHYVVVPFDADSSRWLANAHQSLHQALINPEGNGWY